MSHDLTLSSLAMLKINIDNGNDYLDYLRPYVLQVLVESPPEVVSDESIAVQLRNLCGLEIPRRTVHIVLHRLARAGYLKKTNGVYTIVKDLPTSDTSVARTDAKRHITAINKKLVLFAQHSANREITEEQATDCFIAFLSQFSIPCLKSYLRGTTLPSINGHCDWQIMLVSQFVNELMLEPDLFDSFMKLVQGHMLANALLCPDLQSVTDSYKDVVFYFDTPLLIQLLGLEGDEEKQALEEVISLVQHLKGRIAYFSHTYDELVNAITISADFIDSPKGRGTIVDEARKSGITKSDLLLIAQGISETFEKANIFNIPTPPYNENTYKFEIGEDILSTVLDDEINYHNQRAREYDIRSVRSIYVLREGMKPFSIEKSRAVFVTNNTAFSKASYEYGKNHEQSREISTVITDFSLANTAWLKAPQGAPSLPKKEVIAFAYAALRPSIEFWNKVLVEAEKLERNGTISARSHQLLRSSHLAQKELMKLTLGEEEALTEESITTILNRVTAEIKNEETLRLNQSEIAHRDLLNQLNDQVSQIDEIKQKIYWNCNRKAEREAKILSSIVWLSQFAIALMGIITILKAPNIAGWIAIAIAIISGTVRLVGTLWDIKPLKFIPVYTLWRRSKLIKNSYKELSIKD